MRNVGTSGGDGRGMPNDELDLVDVEAVVLRDRVDGLTGLDPVEDRSHCVAVEPNMGRPKLR
jgi:hypothetical protein